MKRHEFWRHAYRERRYCEHLSKAELDERISCIITNLLRLTPDAKVGLPEIDNDGAIWMELFTHALEEMHLRYGPYPGGFSRDIFNRNPLPDFAGELADRAAGKLRDLGLNAGEFFIKYGSPRHMRRLLNEGNIRIQSASYYKKPSHNGAVRDDETSLSMSLRLTREDIVKLVTNPEAVPEHIQSQRLDLSHVYGFDYWLYCVTESLESRLFVDFDATACVVVTDRDEFVRRVSTAMAEHEGHSVFSCGPAQYVDPLLPRKALIDIPFAKHFKYSYQREFRMIWEPDTQCESLGYVDLNLGSVADIAELVLL